MIAKLRERVTLQTRGTSVDEIGAVSYAWTDVVTVWGRMEPATTREPMVAERARSERGWQLTIRRRGDLDAIGRVSWKGRTFEVVGSPRNVDERRRYIVLDLDEWTAGRAETGAAA